MTSHLTIRCIPVIIKNGLKLKRDVLKLKILKAIKASVRSRKFLQGRCFAKHITVKVSIRKRLNS